jgi:hypothetical protein
MAVSLSVLRAGRALPPRKTLGTHLYKRLSRLRAIVQLKGFGQLEKIH